MSEHSTIKFDCRFVSRRAPTNSINPELIQFCRQFVKEGFSQKLKGEFKGNLSYRLEEDFVITPSSISLDNFPEDELVRVADWDYDKFKVSFIGLMLPSSETFSHAVVYDSRKEINAVFHGHLPKLLEKAESLSLPITEKAVEKGTIEEANEIKKLLEKNPEANFLIIRGHGFLSLGKNMKDAMENCLEIKKKLML